MKNALSRFQGDEGHRALQDALLTQKLVAGDRALAEAMAHKVHLVAVAAGEAIITQDSRDRDVFLILAGLFNIVINGKLVSKRSANEHIGEMAAIDPAQSRSASVVAEQPAVVARLSEADLADLAQRFPDVYRRIARELGRRLHQRNAHIGSARTRVQVLIACADESLAVARAVQEAFRADDFLTTVWSQGVFRASGYALEGFLEAIDASDFAVAIAHPGGNGVAIDVPWPGSRDAIAFELGLFIGRLGKDRAILMEPRAGDTRLPSDLAGLTSITYRSPHDPQSAGSLATACDRLREHIRNLGANL